MTEHMVPDRLGLKTYSREWCREVIARVPWSKIYSRRLRYHLVRASIDDYPTTCSCGAPHVRIYSLTGKWETLTDYIFECEHCHNKRLKVLRPVGRPKGSKTKNKDQDPKPVSKLDWWEQMCKDAEIELYG